ncbi:MAG: DUF2860 domain-containing protein [Proteobacteria bacterium]|nr:DUF2860 domain-containing protein [Pseudomonadota bacterium]
MYLQRMISFRIPLDFHFIRIFGICAIIVLLGSGYVPIQAQNILIYSTSHSNTEPSQTTEGKGILIIEISTFTPILEIRINDETKSLQEKSSARFELPYTLKPGTNRFDVYVRTQAGTESKDFELFHITAETKAPVKDKKPYMVNILIGTMYTDNAESAPKEDPKISAGKLFFILNPIYIERLDDDSSLVYQAVLLREKYFGDKEISSELAFSQVGLSWLNEFGFGEWKLSLGGNNIGTKTQGVFGLSSAEHHQEADLFLSGHMRIKANEGNVVDLELKVTRKDVAFAESDNHNEDGNLSNLDASWALKVDEWHGKLSLGYELNDAFGKYMDYTTQSLGLGVGYPLGKWTLDGQLGRKQTGYTETDILTDKKEKTSLNSLSIKGSYKFPKSPGRVFMADFKGKQQTSNLDSKKYRSFAVSAAMLFSF